MTDPESPIKWRTRKSTKKKATESCLVVGWTATVQKDRKWQNGHFITATGLKTFLAMTSLWITPLKFIHRKTPASRRTDNSYIIGVRTDDDLYVGVITFGFGQPENEHWYFASFNPGQRYTPK